MSAAPGAAITVSGNNYEAEGRAVRVQLVDQSNAAADLGIQYPDEKGSFTLAVTLPSDVRPGDYVVIAKQTRGSAEPMVGRVQNTFRVLAPGEAPPPSPPGPGTGEAPPPPPPGPGTGESGTGQKAPTTPPEQPGTGGSLAGPAASDPATAKPAAISSPAASPVAPAAAAPAPATRSSAAPAPVVPAAAAAAPVADEQPAAPVAIEEPAASGSLRSATSDLWSGFNGQSADQVPTIDGPAVPANAPADSLAGGIALLVVGTLTLLAGVGVAVTRRTRARVQA